MASFTTKSSHSSHKLMDRSKSMSVGSTIRYSGIQNQDLFRIKNSLEEMFRRRANRTSYDMLERRRGSIRSSNQKSETFYQGCNTTKSPG